MWVLCYWRDFFLYGFGSNKTFINGVLKCGWWGIFRFTFTLYRTVVTWCLAESWQTDTICTTKTNNWQNCLLIYHCHLLNISIVTFMLWLSWFLLVNTINTNLGTTLGLSGRSGLSEHLEKVWPSNLTFELSLSRLWLQRTICGQDKAEPI